MECFRILLIETQFKPFTAIRKDGDGSTKGSLNPTHYLGEQSQFYSGCYSTGRWERRVIRYSEERKQRKQRGKDEKDQIDEMPHGSFFCHSQKLSSNYFGIEDLRLYFLDTQY